MVLGGTTRSVRPGGTGRRARAVAGGLPWGVPAWVVRLRGSAEGGRDTDSGRLARRAGMRDAACGRSAGGGAAGRRGGRA